MPTSVTPTSNYTTSKLTGKKVLALTPAQHNQFLKQMMAPYISGTTVSFGTSTGNEPATYDEEDEVTKTTKQHSKGYYYVISVSDNADVFYQVFKGNKVAYVLHKVFGKIYPHKNPIDDNEVWKSVRKRTHLPATVGATYLEIDADILAHKEAMEHDGYAKGILAAEPEGLKMIEGLEKLAEGDPDDDYPDGPTPSGQAQYASSLGISGQGSFYGRF